MSVTTRHLMKRALDVLPSKKIDSVTYFKMADIVKLIDLADDVTALTNMLIKVSRQEEDQ